MPSQRAGPAVSKPRDAAEVAALDEFLWSEMPQPVALVWRKVCSAHDPVKAANAAQYAVEGALGFLLSCLLAEEQEPPSPALHRHAQRLDDRAAVGLLADLVLAYAIAVDKAPKRHGAFARRVGEWLRPGGKGGEAERRLRALVRGRNDASHNGVHAANDPVARAAYVDEVRALLESLRWLADFTLVTIVDDAADTTRGCRVGRVCRWRGHDLNPVPSLAFWYAPLPREVPLLVWPGGVEVLSLQRTLAIVRAGPGSHALVLLGRDGATLLLCSLDDKRERKALPLGSTEVGALFELGAPSLAIRPVDGVGEQTLAGAGPRAPAPSSVSNRHGVASLAAPARSTAAFTTLASLLVALPLVASLWWGERPPSSLLRGAGAGATDAAALAAASTATTDEPLAGDDAGGNGSGELAATASDLGTALALLRARCAEAPPADDRAALELDVVSATADALLAGEPRDAAAAAALFDALRPEERCDRAVVEVLAGALRPPQIGLRAGVEDQRLERAVALERWLARASEHAQAVAAAAGAHFRAALDLLRLRSARIGRMRLDDTVVAAQVEPLLDAALTHLCAAWASGDEGSGAGELARGVDADDLDDLIAGGLGGDGAGRSCALALLGERARGDDHASLRARLQWLGLRAEASCCWALESVRCGDRAGACADDLDLVAGAAALCAASAAPADARAEACTLAVDLADRALTTMALLPSYDPRCLPAERTPAGAARRLLALRREPAQPRRAQVARYTALERAHQVAYDAAVAALAEADVASAGTDLRGDDLALAALRMRFVARYTEPPAQGCRAALREDAGVAEADAVQADDLKERLAALEASADPAVAAEAAALACRAHGYAGDDAVVAVRVTQGRCPP